MRTHYKYIFIIYYTYKICLPIKFALTHFYFQRQLLSYSYSYLPFHYYICRSWTSLSSTVFIQLVSSYNYERLIRSISTPFCLPNKYAFSYSFNSTPFTYTPLIYSLYKYTFTRTYICTPLFLPLFSYSLLLFPLYIHIICTHNMYAFFLKIFPKKISTPKTYLKFFPKFLLIIILLLLCFPNISKRDFNIIIIF